MVKPKESIAFFLGAMLIISTLFLWIFTQVHTKLVSHHNVLKKHSVCAINLIDAREFIEKKPTAKPSKKNITKKVTSKPLKKAELVEKIVPPKKEVLEEEVYEEEMEEELEDVEFQAQKQREQKEILAEQSRLLNEKELYLSALSKWIKIHLNYPRIAKRLRQEGTVEISFTIHKNGNIDTINISSSCPYKRLNQAANKLLVQHNLFKPLPKSMNKWELKLPITYALNN